MVLGGMGGAVMGGLAGGAVVSIVINGVDSFSKTFTKAGIGLKGLAATAGVAGIAVAAGIAVIGVQSVKTFAKVETGFAQVNTLLGEGEDSYELYGDAIRKVSNEMGLQGGEVAALSGLYQTISAGITDTAEAEEFLLAASTAAVGGSAELSSVINVGTKTMAAFGDEAGSATDVMDTFAAAVVAGQTTMPELANAFPKVAGLAAEMGMSLDETAGAFAGLTKIMGNSDVTATGMKATLTQLLKPQADLQAGLESIGFASGKAAIEELGLVGTLDALQKSVGGDVVALGNMFGNVRAITTVLPAVGKAADEISDSMDIMANKTGLSSKQFGDMDATAAQGFTKLKNTVAGMISDIGRIITPALMPLVTVMADFFAKIDIEKIKTFAIAMKKTLLPIWEGFKNLIKEIMPIVKLFWNAMVERMKIILPIAKDLFIKTFEIAKDLFKTIAPIVEGFFEKTNEALKVILPIAKDIFVKTLEIGLDMFKKIVPIAMFLWDNIKDMLKVILPPAKDFFMKVLSFGKKIFDGIVEVINRNKPTIESLFKNMGVLGAILFKVLGHVFDILGNVWDIIVDSGLLDIMIMGFDRVVRIVKMLASWLEPVFSILSSIFEVISDVIHALANSKFGQFIAGAFKAGKQIGDSVIDALTFDDFMIAPGGQPMAINPNDTIVGYKGDSPFGGGVTVNIENIYGTDPSEMSAALEENLMGKISL